MKKLFSYRKIRCFVRVTMFKKQAMLTKKGIDFCIQLSLNFREKSMQNREKACRTIICTKINKKNMFGTWFFSEKSILDGFSESLQVPGKVQKGRATLGKTAPWRDLVQFCSFESSSFAAGSISTPFGHNFNTILTPFCLLSGIIFIPLWHKRDCLPTVQHDSDLLSVSGPAECAKRFE